MSRRIRMKWRYVIWHPSSWPRAIRHLWSTSVWIRRSKQHPRITVFIALLVLFAMLILLGGYKLSWDWTGFNGRDKSDRTLWDWMQLLFIPVALAVAGFWFNDRERKIEQQRVKAEQEISSDNQSEAAMKDYIDNISELLLHENLSKSELESEVGKVARVRTLTVLHRLDHRRKGTILQFLYEAGLINKDKPSVDLQGADLMKVLLGEKDLHGAMLAKVQLNGANLRDTNLSGADLSDASLGTWLEVLSLDEHGEIADARVDRTLLHGANLSCANLRNADLDSADFSRADLSKATLDGARLRYTDLCEADLTEASLLEADLDGANLKGAKVSLEQLEKARSLRDITMPDGTKHA